MKNKSYIPPTLLTLREPDRPQNKLSSSVRSSNFQKSLEADILNGLYDKPYENDYG